MFQYQLNRLFFSAVLLAAAVRLYLFWQYYCVSSDGAAYIDAARDFYAGDAESGLVSVYPFVGDWELAGQFLSIFFGVGWLFPLFWIIRDVFNKKIALIACYLATVSPYWALFSVHVRTGSRYFFLATLARY